MGAGGVICLADGKRPKGGIERGDVLSLYEVRGDLLFTKAFYMYGHRRLEYLVDERYLGRFCSGRLCLPRDFSSLISDLLPGLGRPSAGTLGEEVGPLLPDLPARWGRAWVLGDVAELRLGARRYELSDWLGNVRVVVADQRLPIYKGKKLVGYRAEVVSVTDYYSFGAEISMRSYEAQPWYRYGYIEAHKDALKSPVKLFVGSYRGTIRVVDGRTLELIAYNTTTPNSLFYHIGRYLSDRGIVSVRIHLGELLYPFFSFRPTEREYRFLINIEK